MIYRVSKLHHPIIEEIEIPPDKSISHRALILGSMGKGETVIHNLLESKDVLSTVRILKKLGVKIQREKNLWKVKNTIGFKEPLEILNAGNSGTTARLMMGVLSSLPFISFLTGDKSLRRRPMDRVIIPLSQMGAEFWAKSGKFLPLAIKGAPLKPIHYTLPIPSAQVKSAIILAALRASGETTIREPLPSRDHTERMVKHMGGEIFKEEKVIKVKGSELYAREFKIPGDLSSASFFITLALLIPGSRIVIKGVGLNPTRKGFLELLKKIGGRIEENIKEKEWEPRGDLIVEYSELKPFKIGKKEIPLLIDEIPLLALIATQIEGISEIRDAEELRVKESDRIKSTVGNLRLLGAEIEELPDGMIIKGKTILKGNRVRSFGDHRIAMMLIIAGLIAEGETIIEGAECVDISFPGFFGKIESLF